MSEHAPTIGSLLEFDFERPPDAEIAKLREYGGLVAGAFETQPGLTERFWVAAGANVFRALGKALDRPVTELFASGWNHYQPFLEFRDVKRHPPGVPAQKELYTHTIDAALSPSVKVLLNGKQVGELKFQFVGALKLEAGTLTIQDGKFISLRPGKCWATAALKFAGKPLLERKSKELVLPGELHFGDGIPILPV
jgi:hypothetical protein